MISEQSLKDKIRKVAKEKALPIQACWKQLFLERFLARLASSSHANKFIFKGGFLLSYLIEIGRETVDLDFLLTRIETTEDEIQSVFKEILLVQSIDGFTFSFDSIKLLTQPHMDYPGYRITLNVKLANIRDKVQVDIGVGDTVYPLSYEIPLTHYRGQPFFESTISLLTYPPETIFAEKLETILSKGSGNSRMKDYHDLLLLIRKQDILNLEKLQSAVADTFSNRRTSLHFIKFNEISIQTIQKFWTFHIRSLGNLAQDLNLPTNITIIIEEINDYIAILHEISIEPLLI